jgi:hypothetical protein
MIHPNTTGFDFSQLWYASAPNYKLCVYSQCQITVHCSHFQHPNLHMATVNMSMRKSRSNLASINQACQVAANRAPPHCILQLLRQGRSSAEQ